MDPIVYLYIVLGLLVAGSILKRWLSPSRGDDPFKIDSNLYIQAQRKKKKDGNLH
jgi:hypothetical protein